MTHLDALSRHVGAVVQGGTLEKEDVLREQAKDTFCLKQSPFFLMAHRVQQHSVTAYSPFYLLHG